MVSEQITIWGIGVLLAFFIPIVISNRIIGLNINKDMIISVARRNNFV